MMSTEDEAGLVLRGPLTLRHAPGIRDRLLAALGQNPRLALEIEDEGDVDVSFVQILLAARLSARISGGDLRLSRPPGEGLGRVLAEGGFDAVDTLWASGSPA